MTEANVVALCACLGLRIPVVISERNQPDRPGLTMVRQNRPPPDLSLGERDGCAN